MKIAVKRNGIFVEMRFQCEIPAKKTEFHGFRLDPNELDIQIKQQDTPVKPNDAGKADNQPIPSDENIITRYANQYGLDSDSLGVSDGQDNSVKSSGESGSGTGKNEVGILLDNMPELTGSVREKLLAVVQDTDLKNIINELYRPGATVGDGGTADILVKEYYEGSSKHLIKAKQRLKQLDALSKSGKLGLNDLDIVDALRIDLENAISLFE